MRLWLRSSLSCVHWAEFCNFGTSLDDMLRDRLICGINNSKLQQKLLAEKKLTFTSAIEMAQGAKNAKEIAQQDGDSNSERVHRISPSTRGKDTRSKFTGTCFCCGKVGHKRGKCRLKNAFCHGCGRTGHIQSVRRSKPGAKRKPKPAGKKPVHHVEESPEESLDDSNKDCTLYIITQAETVLSRYHNQ